jgi:hypothetical protein
MPISPLDVRMKEIGSRFAIKAIRDVSPRNPIQRQANSDRPAKTGLEQLFTKTKQIEGIDENIYWSKRLSWKRPRYNRIKKAYSTTRKIMKNRENSYYTTLLLKGSCMVRGILIL